MKENTSGITIITLIVIIVILLILAGVSIAMLTGDNGILKQARAAKENTARAKEQEEKDLDKTRSYINEKTIKDNYTDINGDKATIPEGFKVDETENIISKGLVVHGPDKANGDNGSEFVWVPVKDINSMSQCSTAGGDCNLQLESGTLKCKTHNDSEDIVGKLYAGLLEENFGKVNTKYDSNLREPAILTGNKENDYDNDFAYNTIKFTLETLKQDYKNMATSVAIYKGFYIGRYETSLSNATETSAGTSETSQSKQGVIPTTANNKSTWQWYGLYKVQNKTYTGKNKSVESNMIWGSQYDAMLNWVKTSDDKEKITDKTLGNISSGKIATTGNSLYAKDNINNIRDLEGNLREFTLEASESQSRVNRGGYYNLGNTCAYRFNNSPKDSAINNGSRLALYIK